ncbi:MAG TPA: BrnA antitoxin family protein [Rhizomicrobium sp.]|jgi:uncharacterized protein (DUF4415 family)
MKRRSGPVSKDHSGRTDWKRIAKLSDQEIERIAVHDAENPATKKEDWAEAFIGLPPHKTPVNANFDVDVVQWFKSRGRGYQAHMNAVLRHYMEVHRTEYIYERCVEAILKKRLLAFRYQGFNRVVCPHVLGSGKEKLRLLAFQIGGESSQPLPREGIWRCFSLNEIEAPELQEGKWRTAERHERPNTCVVDVHIDINRHAKQHFDWKSMKWREPAL